MKSNLKGSLILLLCACIWGMAFSAQSEASNYIGPYTFVCLRSAITSIVLFTVRALYMRSLHLRPSFARKPFKKKLKTGAKPPLRYNLILGSLLGAILFAACTLQQIGIQYTSAAKSGFITAFYIVLIPIMGLLLGRRIGIQVLLDVVVSLVGMGLLCLKDDLSVNKGDLITLGCAFMFSLHIIVIDRYAQSLDSILLSAIQFAVGAIIALPFMLLREKVDLSSILACRISILYAGVCSGAIGYTLQIVGQKYCEPTLASLMMCLESVFAALGGWILLGQKLSTRELTGCALMFVALLIAQIPLRRRSRSLP